MTVPSAAAGGSLDGAAPAVGTAGRDKHTLAGTGIGNALEWFDWSIYSTFAPFFAASFFFPGDPISAFLSALVVFAVGFVARPVGGFLFGRVADRLRRKRSPGAHRRRGRRGEPAHRGQPAVRGHRGGRVGRAGRRAHHPGARARR
jgi:MFS family permease